MQVDFLIVGQGITGTLLSYELIKAGKSVLVTDRAQPGKASLVAGAVINPLSGKGYSPAQHADRFIPLALQTYRSLETLLDKALLREQTLYAFPQNEDEVAVFDASVKREGNKQLHWMPPGTCSDWTPYFNTMLGIGVQRPVWQVDAAPLLDSWRDYLLARNAYRAGVIDYTKLFITEDRVRYEDITARTVVFCEGTGAWDNPYLAGLPFTRNRGDVLLLSAPGLPHTGIYHRGLRLVPRADGLFWCGSNYRWQFDNLDPDITWCEQTEVALRRWLRIPFTLAAHLVAERPTTAGQVPLIGRHPQYPAVAVFNGLGTRGFSSGPYWAAHLSRLLSEKNIACPNTRKRGWTGISANKHII